MFKTITAAAIAVAAFAYAADGTAGQIVNGASGLSSPDTTITFDEIALANATPLTNQYSALGVTFSDMFYRTQPLFSPNLASPLAANFGSNFIGFNPFSIHFTSDVRSAAFVVASNDGTSTFEALLDGAVVDSFTATTDPISDNNFFGFIGFAFDEIRVTIGSSDGNAAIDSLQFAAVPTPASLALLASGILGLGLFRRRR
jgi:hypothetical protein